MDAERPPRHTHAERGHDEISMHALKAVCTPAFAFAFAFLTRQSRHHKSRLGCRLNAGGAQWVERHGCRESAVRTWMSVRRGPTERRLREGTPTKEEPNQEQRPLVTWGFSKSLAEGETLLPSGRTKNRANSQCRYTPPLRCQASHPNPIHRLYIS